MAKNQKSSSHVISFVFMIAFAVIMAVIGYATWKGGMFELRSKASNTMGIIKSWTFAKDKEGWLAYDFGKSLVASQDTSGRPKAGGIYTLVIGPKYQIQKTYKDCSNNRCKTRKYTYELKPRIQNSKVDAELLYSKNSFRMRLSVTGERQCQAPPACMFLRVPCAPQDGVVYCDKDTYVATSGEVLVMPKNMEVPVSVSYRLRGKRSFEPPVTMKVNADAGMQDISFDFPESVVRKRIDVIQVSFEAIRKYPNVLVQIEEIQIQSTNPTPTEEITPGSHVSCNTDSDCLSGWSCRSTPWEGCPDNSQCAHAPYCYPPPSTDAIISCGSDGDCPSSWTCLPAPGGPCPNDGSVCPRCYPKQDLFTCPENGYINCFPTIGKNRSYRCSTEYTNWAKVHCPDIKIAY